MKRFDCEQGSAEWFALRRGVPTASEFHRIITPVQAQLSKSCDSYIFDLIGELADPTGVCSMPVFENGHMERGRQLEPEARGWLSMTLDMDIEQVGFCLSDCGRWGCSPDGMIGDNCGLEIKVPKPSTHAAWLHGDGLPESCKCQVHGGMAVTGLSRWSFLSYQPRAVAMPPLLVHVERDDFTDKLAAALEQFWKRYREVAGDLGVSLEKNPIGIR
jgi:YqaJ-like viral recombinase domain